jgi:hypothetical protein
VFPLFPILSLQYFYSLTPFPLPGSEYHIWSHLPEPYPSRFVRYCPIHSLYQDVYCQQLSQDPQPVRDAIARFADSGESCGFPGASGTDPVIPDASGVRYRSGCPVPHLVDPPRRSPITPPAPQVTIPADAVIGGPVGAAPKLSTQTSPVGGPLIEVFQMISSLMTKVSELRGTVTAIEAEQSSVKEQYEALRASYLDLEEIMLREIADPEESNKKKKNFKKKKKSTPLNGDARCQASRS